MIPRTIEELKYMAGLVIKCGLAPDSYKGDAAKICIGIMKGLEVGMAPLAALSSIAIINNRPTIWGDGAVALAQSQIDRMTETEIGTRPGDSADTAKFADDYGIEVKVWRKGQADPYVGRFTVGDAKRAKLWMNPQKQPWHLYPKRMLRMRAIGFALRNGFADCLAGMMIREEVEDLPPVVAKVDTAFLDTPAKQIEAPRPVWVEAHRMEIEKITSLADLAEWHEGFDPATLPAAERQYAELIEGYVQAKKDELMAPKMELGA